MLFWLLPTLFRLDGLVEPSTNHVVLAQVVVEDDVAMRGGGSPIIIKPPHMSQYKLII
jgi:hypothetical protein